MGSIVVVGGSVIGSAVAMMLARDGHDVTVLEADPNAPPAQPAEAWDGWGRTGVAQFHQPHNLFPRTRAVLDAELPGLVDDLEAGGGIWVDPLAGLPPFIEDRSPRPDDDRFRFITGRRPFIEAVVASAATREPGVSVRRGVTVAGLEVDGSRSVRRVTGVRAGGEVVPADLVVDASGRRSHLAEWLTSEGGAAPQVDSADSGFTYYTRYFCGPEIPQTIGPIRIEYGSISVLTLPGDNGTWSVTVWGTSDDIALRALKDPAAFERVVRACVFQAHWLDGEPISDVLVMSGILDKHRRFVVDGRPVALGVVAVGDAWACTNPSAGRGISVGLVHAQALRSCVEDGLADGDSLMHRFDAMTQERVSPFYWQQVSADRKRLTDMAAFRAGLEPERDPVADALAMAMRNDPDVFRAALEVVMCLSFPDEVMERPVVREGVQRYYGQSPDPFPGPDREELLALLA